MASEFDDIFNVSGGLQDAPKQWHPGMERPDETPPGERLGSPPPGAGDPDYPPTQGYEGIGFRHTQPMMPILQPPPQGHPPSMQFSGLEKRDEADCRAAVIQHVSEHCCYGTRPAKEMDILKIDDVTALHYILETFTERRNTKNASVPYEGGNIDGPYNGIPPPPWDIPCLPRQMFYTHHIVKEVPHTSVVQPCHQCEQKGWHWCWMCGGHGRDKCTTCGGDGTKSQYDKKTKQNHQVNCVQCDGSGQKRCHTCEGDGRIKCDECQGFGWLRCYIELTISFTSHKDDYILETTDMPDQLVREGGGKLVFEDTKPMVWPIVSYPVKEINEHSQRLVNSHRGKWPAERILNQRQRLRGVPVTEVKYTWYDHTSKYWIYGNQRKVYAPDYPHRCCCGCEIL